MAERGPVRLFGEPLHPALVHVPLGALVTAPIWDALGVLQGADQWWAVGFWTIALGLCAALLAAGVGFVDYTRLPEGPAADTGTRHLMLMLTGVALFVGRLLLQGGPAPPAGGGLLLGASLAGALVIGVGGALGGRLVFRHGIGQRPRD